MSSGHASGHAGASSHALLRRLAEASFVCLVVLLPALVVGAQLDAPATAGELHRLARAASSARTSARVGATAEAHSLVADGFFLAAVGAVPSLPNQAAEQAALVGRARLGQMAFVLALSGLVYLASRLARGQLAGACACVALATLPPILHEGYLLRPETPAAVFGLLAVVLLQYLARTGIGSRGRMSLRALVTATGVLACACSALGLALAALPTTSLLLIVPGCVLSLAVLQHAWRTQRIWRRRGLVHIPLHALNRRLLPWTAASLFGPLAVALFVHLAVQGAAHDLAPSRAGVGLLPSAQPQAFLIAGLAVLGAVVAVLRVGSRFGRRGRVAADLVLLVYCAVQLAWHLANPGINDTLRIAPALAILLGEGVLALVVLGVGLTRAVRRPTSAVRDR